MRYPGIEVKAERRTHYDGRVTHAISFYGLPEKLERCGIAPGISVCSNYFEVDDFGGTRSGSNNGPIDPRSGRQLACVFQHIGADFELFAMTQRRVDGFPSKTLQNEVDKIWRRIARKRTA